MISAILLFALTSFAHGPAEGAAFVVTTAADSGPGSLRQAVLDANAAPGPDVITFSLPSSPSSIALWSTITCTDPVTIDATTQPGFGGQPVVELTGASGFPLFDGLHLAAGSSVVRGLALGGFAWAIVIYGPGGNRIEGCFLGTDLSGTGIKANQAGVYIASSPDNVIGGATATQRNLISGNSRGVDIVGSGSTNTTIQGNYFGLDVSGTLVLPNSSGVHSGAGASGTVVGGAGPGEGNVFAGNSFEAIGIAGGANTVIQGNLIGVDASGEAIPVGSGFREGINLASTSHPVIGGTAVGAGNVIAGALGAGLYLLNVTGALIQGNRIGTSRSGTLRMGNGAGVSLSDCSDTVIGGSAGGAGNLISDNRSGVSVMLSQGTVIQGNLIGTDVTGTLSFGNGHSGVWVGSGALGTTIGGSDPAAGNVIANNAGGYTLSGGIAVAGTPPDVRVLSNSMYGNNGGIVFDLYSGHAPNDFPDEDGIQNHPEIVARLVGGSVEVAGTLQTVPGEDFTIQIFGNTGCDATGYGQGRTLLANASVITDAAGSASFQVMVDSGTFTSVAATATRAGGATSAFSACVPVSMPSRYYVLSPCRAVDSRGPDGPYGGPALWPGEVRSFLLAGVCGVPGSANAVAANVTVVQPGAEGSLRVMPGDGIIPGTSSVSFPTGRTRANNAISSLSSDGSGFIRIQNVSTAPAHVVLDLSGYFAP